MDSDPFFVCHIYSHRMPLLICFSVPQATAVQNTLAPYDQAGQSRGMVRFRIHTAIIGVNGIVPCEVVHGAADCGRGRTKEPSE